MQTFYKAYKRHFSGIGDITEYCIFKIVVYRFEHMLSEIFSKTAAFTINIHVVSATEIDPFKRTGKALLWFDDLFLGKASIFLNDQCVSRFNLFNIFS